VEGIGAKPNRFVQADPANLVAPYLFTIDLRTREARRPDVRDAGRFAASSKGCLAQLRANRRTETCIPEFEHLA